MRLTSDIIGIVIKSVFANKVQSELGNDLFGISVDSVLEKSASAINSFINSETVKMKQVLLKENMKKLDISEDNIDFVISEIKELLFTTKNLKELLVEYKYKAEGLQEYLWNKYSNSKNGYIECEHEIKKGLSVVTGELISLKFESDNFEKSLLVDISSSVSDINKELYKISVYLGGRFGNLDKNNQEILDMLREIFQQIRNSDKQNKYKKNPIFQNNKKQYYINNWNSSLFLHYTNNENSLTLANVFIMPDFKILENSKINFSKKDTFNKIIEIFAKYNKNSTMLITGVPGIGKSSITSWIANEYQTDERFIILRFRDWEIEELERGLLKAICNTLQCSKQDLNNEILVIDGFDEIKALDIREILLDEFFNDIKDFNNFKCIITSRPAYINFNRFQYVFELKQFDIEKAEIFCRKIMGNGFSKKEKIKSNLDILGIPVILYMAIMSKVDISENPTKPELYDRIFAENGGIFDKFSYDGIEYSEGAQVMRNPENIKKYLKFLGEIAFLMFEKKDLKLYREEYSVPKLEFQGKSISILEFPIKHLFENVESKIEFIHKSIYEYFVADYIFRFLYSSICDPNKVAKSLSSLLKKEKISKYILEFLRFKIRNSALNYKFDVVNKAFLLMLQNGMTYYCQIRFQNVIDCEEMIFANMLEIIHCWKIKELKLDNLICKYIKCNIGMEFNLKGINLVGMDLTGANLAKANLIKANLTKVNLIRANLIGANLIGANLTEANLTGADLTEANLTEADLKHVILLRGDLKKAVLIDANLECAKLMWMILESTNLTGTNLTRANLTGVKFKEADLSRAKFKETILDRVDFYNTFLEESIWHIDSVQMVIHQLRNTNFKYIIIEKLNSQEKLSREKVFGNFLH